MRVRVGAGVITGTMIGQTNVPTYGTASGYTSAKLESYVVRGAGDLTTTLGLSLLRVVGASNQVIFGDSTQPVTIEVLDMGPVGAYPNLAATALAIS
jgi:hypothetical protein